jgi:NAD-dependent SIR2 family protein deacetylase
MPVINIIGFSCYRCGHEWAPEVLIHQETKDFKLPIVCPKCKTPYWNSPRGKDIIRVIHSGIYSSYASLIPLTVFVKSHIKQGDDTARIMEAILSLPQAPPANPKAWLEEKFEKES